MEIDKKKLEEIRKKHPTEIAFIELMNACGAYDNENTKTITKQKL